MCGSSIPSTPSLEANSLNGNVILELLKVMWQDFDMEA